MSAAEFLPSGAGKPGALASAAFDCPFTDHDALHNKAKTGHLAKFDCPEGHSLPLIKDYLLLSQGYPSSAFFAAESVVTVKSGADDAIIYEKKPPCLIREHAPVEGWTNEGYSVIFTHRWTERLRPPGAVGGGTLFVVAVRHRDPWDGFDVVLMYGKTVLKLAPSMLGYEIGDDGELQAMKKKTRTTVRNLGLVFNVSDNLLGQLLRGAGAKVELGVDTVALSSECHFHLQYDDGYHKRPFKHDCFSGVQIRGINALVPLLRGGLTSYRRLNIEKALTLSGHDTILKAGAKVTSNLETEAEFTILEWAQKDLRPQRTCDESPVVQLLNQFIYDLWQNAALDAEQDLPRWEKLGKDHLQKETLPAFLGGFPADLQEKLAAKGMRDAWKLFHVPKYWKGFEEESELKGWLNEDGKNQLAIIPLRCSSSGSRHIFQPWTLTDYYCDHPKFLLLRNGGSLRLRCNARGRNLLNVKSMSVKLDHASTVRFCSNIQLSPRDPSWSVASPQYLAAISNLLKDRKAIPVCEAVEAVLRPPVPAKKTVGTEASFVKLKTVKEHDPYKQFFGPKLEYKFRVVSTRHRFRFSGAANIELSFDVSICYDLGGVAQGLKVGMEFGLDHAGINSSDTHTDVTVERTREPPRMAEGLSLQPSEKEPSKTVVPTLDNRFYDPYDLAEAEVCSPDGYRSAPFLLLRDAILECLEDRFRKAQVALPGGDVYKSYFRIAGFKANQFASEAFFGPGPDGRDQTGFWPSVRVFPKDIQKRPEDLPEVTENLWKK